MLKRMFAPSVHVKPVVANDDYSQWMVVQQTPLAAFRDELRRYGVKVALYNLWKQVTL